MDSAIVNHLFVTQRFLSKGRVATGGQRLTDFLKSNQRPFLAVEDITLIDLVKGDRIVSNRGQIRAEDVLFAHEFLDVAGDQHLRSLFEREEHEYRMASIYFHPPSGLEIVGRVRQEVLDGYASDQFFVIHQPNLRGLDMEGVRELGVLRRLSYAIINWQRVHCIFQYE